MKINIPNVTFEVTALCNLSCKYCYNHWKCADNQTVYSSSYESTKRTLKKLFNIAKVQHITFTGGEPFVAERFSELVLFARLKGASVTVISNGTYAPLSDYKTLVDLGVSLFELPIHSHNEEIHDSLVQRKGSWDKAVTTIKGLLDLNANVVAVIVLTKENCKEIEKTLGLIHDMGIDRVMINRINIGGEVIKRTSDLLMTRDELRRAFNVAATVARKRKMSISSNVCTPICILNPKEYRGIQFSSCSFEMEKRSIVVDYKGDVRFCNHSPIGLGNIFENRLETILNSPKVQEWKTIVPDFCVDCKVYHQCKAGCRAASEQLGLSLKHPDPIMDHMELDHSLLKSLKPI